MFRAGPQARIGHLTVCLIPGLLPRRKYCRTDRDAQGVTGHGARSPLTCHAHNVSEFCPRTNRSSFKSVIGHLWAPWAKVADALFFCNSLQALREHRSVRSTVSSSSRSPGVALDGIHYGAHRAASRRRL